MERKLADLWEHLSEDGTVELRSTTVVEDGTIPKGSRLTVRRRETTARGDAEFMIVCEIPMYAEERSEWWREPVFLGPEALTSSGEETEPAHAETTDHQDESETDPGWNGEDREAQGADTAKWGEQSTAATGLEATETDEEPGWTDAEIERMAQGSDATSEELDLGDPPRQSTQRAPTPGAETAPAHGAATTPDPTPSTPTQTPASPETGWSGDRSAPFDDDMDF